MQVAIAQTVESLDALAEVKHEQRVPDAAAVVASLRPTPVRPSSVPMGWPQPTEPPAVKNVAQHVDELREWLQHWQASQGGLFRQQQPSHETAQVAYRDLMSTLDAKVKALQQQGMELSQINQAAPAPAAEASTGAEDAKGIVAWGVGPGGTQWPVLWSGTELVYLFGTHEWSVVNTLKTGADDFHIVPRRTVDVDALQEWNGPHHDALSTGPVKVALRQLFQDAMTEATV
ncbi:hypothetical protein DYB28_002787 [Aphanomyces astaci]|uniref:Uncharacterized protein n=1 Tax=Aphanomyces astaci TaxID=112090 RepID=A0A9X8E691_APHAT|nr:hypothetical protein DYB28_002787 [Aphanomyces astaci]